MLGVGGDDLDVRGGVRIVLREVADGSRTALGLSGSETRAYIRLGTGLFWLLRTMRQIPMQQTLQQAGAVGMKLDGGDCG